MAEEYPRERRGGFSVWGWIFVAIVIGFLIWLFVVPATNYRARPTPTAPTAGPITDVAAIHDTPTSYVGRQVELRNVSVQKTLSDSAFWVGSDGNEVLVVRGGSTAADTGDQTGSQQPAAEQGMPNQSGTAGTSRSAEEPKKGNEQQKAPAGTNTANVSQGQKLDVNGTIEPFPGVDEAQQQWNISKDQAQELRDKAAVVVIASEVAPGGTLGEANLPQSDQENNATPPPGPNTPHDQSPNDKTQQQPANPNQPQENPPR